MSLPPASPPARPPLSRRRLCAFRLVMILLMLLVVELAVRFSASQGWLVVVDQVTSGRTEPVRFLGDLNPHFGPWHLPNADITVKTRDGDVRYTSNAHGMRDRPRELKSARRPRVVVLGDSFVEGLGVQAGDRFTDQLEAKTGIEFLNFGTAGGLGSAQEWLLYQHLASQFDHDRVFVFLLPENDFEDNARPGSSSTRYRPFLVKQAEGYRVEYPYPFEEVDRRQAQYPLGLKIRHHIYNCWHTLNVLQELNIKGFKQKVRDSSYDSYTPEDLDKLLFTYGRLVDAASPRPVTLFVIPRDSDFVAWEGGRHQGRIVEALRDFAAKREGVAVVDLLPGYLDYMKRESVSHKAFFLPNDPHWSPLGHQVAAGLVLKCLE